tara:strand:- start:517 stop:630 length:114 start_codon:yes stop_codon:yes gene_type:complete
MGLGDSSLKYPIGLSQFKKLVLTTMFGVAKKRKEKNE